MADTRTFTLIGKFDDQITPSLKNINKEIAKLSDLFKTSNKNFSQFNTGATDFAKSLDKVTKSAKEAKEALSDLGKIKTNMKGAAGAADSFSKSMKDVGKSKEALKGVADGMESIHRSAKKAHDETRGLLQTILKAEAFSKVGEGFAEGLQEGAHKTVEILHKGVEFMAERFKEAIHDEGEEVKSQMQYYSQIKAKNLLPDTSKLTGLAKALQDIKNVNIGREQYEIGEANVQQFAKGKAISQDSLTSVYRALSPFMVPDFLQRMGVNRNARADELAKALTTKKDPLTGKTFTDTMGPGMIALTQLAQAEGGGSSGGQRNVIREMQEYVESGMMKPQALAWQNPLFRAQTKALTDKYEGQGMEGTAARARAMTEASVITTPMESLNIASQTVQAGLENLKQAILSPKTGIVSLNAPALRAINPKTGKPYGYGFGVRAATGGAQLDENYNPIISTVKKGSAYAIHYNEITESFGALIKGAKGNASMIKIYQDEQAVTIAKLNQFYVAIHSPMDMITAEVGSLLSKLAKMFGSVNNMFIEPVMKMMDSLGSSLAQLGVTIDILSDDIKRGKRDLAGALGNLMANILKTITTMFGPDTVEKAQGAVGKAIKSFLDAFNKAGGPKFMKQIMDGFKSLIMKVLFNNGNVLQGTTPIANFLITLFAALSAPSVILAIVSGITPLIAEKMTHLIGSVFEKATAKAVVTEATTGATTNLTQSYLQSGGFKKKPKFGSVEQGFTQAAEGGEGIGALGKLGIVAAATTVAIYALGGSAENTNRQLASVGKNIGTSFNGLINTIGRTIGQLTGNVNLASDKFGGLAHQVDLVRVLLFPITSTFQLLDVGATALVLAFQRAGAGIGHTYALIQRLIGHSRQADLAEKKAKDMDQTAIATERMLHDKMAKNDAYNTSIRFGDEDNYAKKLKQDIVAKYRLAQSQALGSKERAKTVSDIDWLKESYKNAQESVGKSGKLNAKDFNAPAAVVPKKQEETTKAVTRGAQETKKQISDAAALQRLTTILESDKTIDATKIGTTKTIVATSQGSKAVAGTVSKNTSVVQNGFNNVNSSLGNLANSIANMAMSPASAAGMDDMGGGGGGGGGGGDVATMVNYAKAAGFKGDDAAIAGAIAMAESGGDLRAHNTNAQTGDNSYGAMQINMLNRLGPERRAAFGLSSNDQLFNPTTNFRVAKQMKDARQGWADWSTYNRGEYKQFLPAARAALRGGGGGYGGMGSLGGAQALAQRDGLVLTSYRGGKHADGSLHYQGRAMDFGGDPGAMRTFANQLKSTRPTELIHNPNASMKNGQYVPPSYWGEGTWAAHANHVHVGYAYGAGKPAFFSSLSGARAWEKKMAPTNASIASVTSNSSEFGGGHNINNSITIHQQPGENAEHLAAIVVQKMGEWVSEARSSTIFV